MYLQIDSEYQHWRERCAGEPELAEELDRIKDKPDDIADRFYRHLAFGTGGLRGVMGAGTNRMNIYTVRRASLGLARYLKQREAAPSVAIAYDSRIKSELFAREAAATFADQGIAVHIYSRLMPTPALSFAVRHLGCSAGVMITASHNPREYNGYKVYGADGCQITQEAAEEILRYMDGVDPFAVIPKTPEGKIETIGDETERAFYDAELAQRLQDALCANLRIVYTPLNGTGLVPVTSVLERAGYNSIEVVESQREPDGNFPTCPFPNPELPEALDEGLALCRKTGADILLATDPDCDRVGVAARDEDAYRLLTGNEVGALLLDYVCRIRIQAGSMPENPVAVKTIVTTPMAALIAGHHGVRLDDVLTGFKYIGETIGRLEEQGEAERFIFGFEESCGYLSGNHVRDKDAVNACLLICDMASRHKANGKTLHSAMRDLYRRFGFFTDATDTFAFEGEQGQANMRALMDGLRARPLTQISGRAVTGTRDYLWPFAPDKTFPSSDVLQYRLDKDALITVRPSGTEPKLKIYYSVRGEDSQNANAAAREYRRFMAGMVSAGS